MGSIYQKAQQEQAREFQQEILDKLEGLPADTPNWREVLKNATDDIMQSLEQPSAEIQPEAKREPWDFSCEKAQTYK